MSPADPARIAADGEERPFTALIFNPMGGDGWGGVERWFMLTAKGLRDRGHRVLSVGKPGSLWTKRCLEEGFETRSTDMRADLAVGEARAVAHWLQEQRVEVVITKLHRGIRLGGLAARMAGHIPVVAFMGLVEVKRGWRYRLTYSLFLHWILTLAPSMRRDILEVGGMPDDRVEALPYGVESEKFEVPSSERDRVRAEWGVGDDEKVLLAVGRLHEQKRFDLLIEAFRDIRERHDGARLVIVGTGSLEESLRKAAAKEGVSDAVVFAGFRSDMPAVFAAGDLFVMSSDDEGLPSVVMEAMASGLGVVTTRVGAMEDLVEDGVSGHIVPRRDPSALAAKVCDVLDEPESLRAMGDAGRARMKEHYPNEECMDRTVDFLLKVAGRF